MTSITNAFIFYRAGKRASGGLVLYFYTLGIYFFHAGFHLPKTKLLVLQNNLITAEKFFSYRKKHHSNWKYNLVLRSFRRIL